MSHQEMRSYKIHTGIELELMICGKKPMSAFCRYIDDSFDVTGGQPFEHYVNTGFLRKKIFYIKNINLNKKMVYTAFSLINEEWRIGIYRSIKIIGQSFWSKDLEIIEGILLGYSMEENQEHIRLMFQDSGQS
ncbi:MAG: hypothetical protein J0H81_11140 [Sphingopyxis terrae]|jgi:hypothetical protein|uniref:hypothetical protein n=1 Tax=uncultured Sphingopyxis sp. TaxID=310581 RepID=UPI001AD36545|nr:hypothetical protein [uncultured Sphingopyxis sp.]MBN8805625.1 hypothetical protein [Sphingopyxis terrae]